jgi:hypothetical protein
MMFVPGDFLGPYRILTESSRSLFSSTYLVEHPSGGTATPMSLTVWPDVHLDSTANYQAFIQACQKIKTLSSREVIILDFGLEKDAPYLVTPEDEASRRWIASIDQRLQQDGARSAIFLSAMQGASTPLTSQDAWRRSPFTKSGSMIQGGRGSRWKIGGAVVLAIIVIAALILHITLPASAATITIIPRTHHVQQALSVVVATQSNQGGDINGKLISYATPPRTQTGKTTGIAHHNATTASGSVIVSHISLNDPSGPQDISASNVTSNNGVAIVISEFTATQGGTVTVPASAQNAGASGNIPAFDINGTYDICLFTDVLCTSPVGHALVQNPHPFTGGSNATNQPVVKQSDIDTLAKPLVTQLTSNAQAALAKLEQQQMQPGDQLALQKPECMPTVNPNHPVNAVSSTVTVSVSVLCYQIAYAKSDFIPGVIHAQQTQVDATYSPNYGLAGDIIVTPPTFVSTDSTAKTATLLVNAESIWAFQMTDAQKQAVAQLIAGKSQSDAKTLTLHFNEGVQDVTMAMSGFGGNLPTNSQAIHVVIKSVTGLHAPAS